MTEREPVSGWSNPTASERKRFLDTSHSVAIVGASANPSRASNFVATYLLSSSSDFEVWLVNPRETEILGQKVFPSLDDVPGTPDIVDVFRRPADCPAIARDAVRIGAATLWIQLGLWSSEAAQIGSDGGLNVVMDSCLKIEHARFRGGLHLAGFDTGIISSRRAR